MTKSYLATTLKYVNNCFKTTLIRDSQKASEHGMTDSEIDRVVSMPPEEFQVSVETQF